MSDAMMDQTVEPADRTAAAPLARPAEVPEKFWDEAAGAVRLDALLKSYGELERKLGTKREEVAPQIEANEADASAMSDATEAEIWQIAPPHPLIESDGELNERLRNAGFSQGQAQLVYDLAAERLLPVLQDALGDIEAQQQTDRLCRHFGGPEAWGRTARQLRSWGQAHLDSAVLDTLASSYEGVMALHQMMQASEPELLAGHSGPPGELDEVQLAEMMRDPRYWRQRDPEFIARVTAGFKRLYAE